jgi:hypothetical protein
MHGKRIYKAVYNQELRNNWPEITINQRGKMETDEVVRCVDSN